MKLYLTPFPNDKNKNNGVGAVIHAQYRHLPDFGIQFVDSPGQADVIAAHINADELSTVDVLHTHGLYFTGDVAAKYEDWVEKVNAQIVRAARRAKAITTCSNWAAMPFKRDMRITPTVINNGVDVNSWKVEQNHGYVLWNKNRNKGVCDPTPALNLAQAGINVISTFGPDNTPIPPTLHLVGEQPSDRMKILIQHSDIYLATTREVHSLSVLEALASGVPILGYNWGGTKETISHKIDGYLVEPGNVQGLIEGYKWIQENRAFLSANCLEKAKLYDWHNVIIPKYVELYQKVLEQKQNTKHRVGVVIPCYNYAEYLPQAIESVLAQNLKADQITVVDDGSTDNSVEIALSYENKGVKLLQQKNQGVAAARNNGIAVTNTEYIVCLDADDILKPEYLGTLQDALKNDPSLGIAYSEMAILHSDGSTFEGAVVTPFNFEFQATIKNPPANCVPCAAMFRKTMWERSGGFKQVYHPAEDAEFWLRGTSIGFNALKVTDRPLFIYRNHGKGAHTKKEYPPIHTYHPWMSDKQYPFAAPSKNYLPVRSYAESLITVVIPVGPGHSKYLATALESLLGQTFRKWEVIVVNDSNEPLDLTAYPFVKVILTEGLEGAGRARNIGLAQVDTPLVLWLDADDYLMPMALERMLDAYIQNEGSKYVYTNWVLWQEGKDASPQPSPDYDQRRWLEVGLHAVTVLMDTQTAININGFDENMKGWEDWDFFIKAAVQGYCGVRLPENLFVYRLQTGKRREFSQDQAKTLMEFFGNRYKEYYEGKSMAGCCGGNKALVQVAKEALTGPTNYVDPFPGAVTLEFVGGQTAPITYKVNGREYVGCRDPQYRTVKAHPEDLDKLLLFNTWRRANG